MSLSELSGILLPFEEPVRYWTDGDIVSAEPLHGVVEASSGGLFVIPGLVDAHCHVGIGPAGVVSLDEAADQARVDRDAGTLLIRDCGSPLDTTPLQSRADLPRIIRAGQHITLPKRYLPALGVELQSEEQLPAAVAEQARRGDGWVKLVGDWIDRSAGDLRPLWSDAALAKAVEVAHEHGARITAHVFSTQAIPGLIEAGVDCLEHATGMSDDSIAAMAARDIALVPTLINVENFPEIADKATKYPAYAAHMRSLHAGADDRVRAAIEAGVRVFAGSDAGGGVTHGRIVDEIIALHRVGMSAADAIGAASWRAREWLERPGGNELDLLIYDTDPRSDLSALRHPRHIVLRGRIVGRGGSSSG